MDWQEGFDYSLLDEEALTFLIDHELDGPAVGVTKQVIAQGLNSLTEKQLNVFKKYVVGRVVEPQVANVAITVSKATN